MALKVGIILQARIGSSRLPGKVLRPLAGRPMLLHILERLSAGTHADALILATSELPGDDLVAELSADAGIPCFRGSERDVLDRYYQAARAFDLEHVVRATADNPFVDPWELDRLIDLHLTEGPDYTHSFGALPIGVGLECMTRAALEASWLHGHAPNHREHVNEYIQENPARFRILELDIPADKRRPDLRLTVDTIEDFQRAEAVYAALYQPDRLISTQEAIRQCES